MIRVYRSRNKLPSGAKILENCSAYFNVYAKIEDFGELEFYAMKEIDSAVPLKAAPNVIETPFGVTTIKSLSSGCKTVIAYLHLCKNYKESQIVAFSGLSCGCNAMNVLFQLMEQSQNNSVVVLLEDGCDFYKCQDHEYLVDNERIVSESCLL